MSVIWIALGLVVVIFIVMVAIQASKPIIKKDLFSGEEITLFFQPLPGWYDSNIRHWLPKARKAWIQDKFPEARFAYQKVGYSAGSMEQDDTDQIVKEQIQFLRTDKWFKGATEVVLNRLGQKPCFVQSDLYDDLGDKETLLLLFYFMEKMNLLKRQPFGRTYLVYLENDSYEVKDYLAPEPFEIPSWFPSEWMSELVWARRAWQQADYPMTEQSYRGLFKLYQSNPSLIKARKNQILLEDEVFQAILARFRPTLFARISDIIATAGRKPVIQSELYKELYEYDKDDLQKFFWMAADMGFVERENSGRSYVIKISARGKRWLKKHET